jgi:hypothetical protein
VTDTLPAGLALVSADGLTRAPGFICSAVGQQITCTLHVWQNLNPGDVHEIEVVARVGSNVAGLNATIPLVNTATAATPNDRDASNNTSAPVTVYVQGPLAGAPTSVGTNVTVQPTDNNNVPQAITVRFSSVTAAGHTTANPVVPPPAAPPRFQFRSVAYDIVTTATVVPPIEVCFTGIDFRANDLIWHAGSILPLAAHTVRTSTQICAIVSSLSPFGVVTPVNQAPSADAGIYPPFEATSPAGATVTLTGVGSDPDGDPLTFTWSEGSMPLGTGAQITVGLSLGMHDVTLTVADGFGGVASSTMRVFVHDTTPPVLTLPPNVMADAISPAGAPVIYLASASDIADPTPSVACTPSSGSVFSIGTTAVTCTAADDSGNSSRGTFNVHVRGAVDQVLALIDKTLSMVNQPELKSALKARLGEALEMLMAKRPSAACRPLNTYIALVSRANTLTPALRAELISDATRIKAVIGCR